MINLNHSRSGRAPWWVYLILVTLSLGGLGAYYLITSPGKAVKRSIQTIQSPKLSIDPKKKLPTNEEMEKLAKSDPITFLEACLVRYDKEVKTGFSCTLQKQERIQGKLMKREVIKVHYKNEPHSVFFEWVENAGRAFRVYYIEDEDDDPKNDYMHIKPSGLGGFFIVKRHVEGKEARASGRYSLNQFGLRKATERVLTFWKKAKEVNALHVEYLGKKKIPEAGNRECFVLHRTKFAEPEADGIVDAKFFFDTETWLQVGSILKNKDGKLIGEYYFRDIRLNPKFDPDLFSHKGLKKK